MGKLDSSHNEQGAKRPSARRVTGDAGQEPEHDGVEAHGEHGVDDDDERASALDTAAADAASAEDSANMREADADDSTLDERDLHDAPGAHGAHGAHEPERAITDSVHDASPRVPEADVDVGKGGKRVHARRPARSGARNKTESRSAPAAPAARADAQSRGAPSARATAGAAPRVRAARASSGPPAQQLIPYPGSAPAHKAAVATQSERVDWPSDAAAPGLVRTGRDRLSTYSGSERGGELVPVGGLSDDFGLDPEYEAAIRPWLERLTTQYARIEVDGAQRVPAQGRVLLVVNHSRAPLWDGILLRNALRLHHETSRVPRWLVDDQQYHAPFLGTFVNRLGAVRACQENAERLLAREELVAVFPEGANAAHRRYEDRHRLQRFGRGGIVKLALRTRTPIIPVGIVMCDHPEAVWRNRVSRASRLLGGPLLSLGPSWARVGLLGVPPIASHIRIRIGDPIRAIERHDDEATRDDALIHELNECVRDAVQELVDAALRA